MTWIKENRFLAILSAATLLGAAALYYVGAVQASRHDQAKAAFDEAAEAASSYERSALYPKSENVAGKEKALGEYRKSVDSVQTAFENFRPKELKNTSAQDFTNRLKEADSTIRKAFEAAGTSVPDSFFVGFENYRTSLARPDATGILEYQLGTIQTLLLDLAAAKPTEFRNLHRPALPEEDGQSFTPAADAVSRALPLEITFTGSEESVRKFISAAAKPSNPFYVIRALRVTSAKKDAPKAEDAQFDAPPAGNPNSSSTDPTAPDTGSAAAPSTGRILSQVLGSENVNVFLRLELLEFLPAKKLP
jgi:hypothetical protein